MIQHTALALTTVVLMANPSNTMDSASIRDIALAAWGLNIMLHVGLICAIAYRLRQAKSSVGRAHSDGGIYNAALYTILESGAVFATATAILFTLAAVRSYVVIAAISPTTQLAVSRPCSS